MVFREIKEICEERGLSVFGALHPEICDDAPSGCQTLLLLGPREPGFWGRIKRSAEFHGGNPVDRWSQRVIGDLARDIHAQAVFPFGGPPFHPFVNWALKSGTVWLSPVNLLVHGNAGLFVSFRGALAFTRLIDLPPHSGTRPCDSCKTQRCLTDCPAGALTDAHYDVASCHDYLNKPQGACCLSHGCLVRRGCPAGEDYQRLAEQSAHHMGFFHKKVN